MKSKKTNESSYCGRTPHRYSELYYSWRAAIMEGNQKRADELSRKHRERFGQ